MSQHMVIFQNSDGDPGYNQFESIEEAVSFVEQIRNGQGIDSIRIFELNEVKFELKPYYKVELQALNAGTTPVRPAPPVAQVAPTPVATAPVASTPIAPAAPPAAAPVAPGSEPSASPFAAPAPESPAFPAAAPVPPADQPVDDNQPTRRGLFGR